MIEYDRVEVEERSTVEGNLQMSPQKIIHRHITGYELFGQKVHHQQKDQKDYECQSDVIDVSEEINVSCVSVE